MDFKTTFNYDELNEGFSADKACPQHKRNLLWVGRILASGDHHRDAGIDALLGPLGREVVALHVLAQVVEEHVHGKLTDLRKEYFKHFVQNS